LRGFIDAVQVKTKVTWVASYYRSDTVSHRPSFSGGAWTSARLKTPPSKLRSGLSNRETRSENNSLGIELDPHQEESGLLVGVLVGVQDVAVVAVDEVGDGGGFAFCIGVTY
jgi:hypothetical protein